MWCAAQNKKGPRIRQGSPQEEEALVSHIISLIPTAQTCSEVGQLTELLILLGHEADARRLQALLSETIAQQKAAADRAGKGKPATEPEVKQAANGVLWKWDILRPIS